ncbi:hypothetical protein Trydic_g22647 [Trypoxylus dichotomus]
MINDAKCTAKIGVNHINLTSAIQYLTNDISLPVPVLSSFLNIGQTLVRRKLLGNSVVLIERLIIITAGLAKTNLASLTIILGIESSPALNL